MAGKIIENNEVEGAFKSLSLYYSQPGIQEGGRGGKETKKLSTAGFLPQHSSVIILLSEGFLVEREALKSWKDFVSLNSEQMKNHAASNSRQHLAKFHKNNPYQLFKVIQIPGYVGAKWLGFFLIPRHFKTAKKLKFHRVSFSPTVIT